MNKTRLISDRLLLRQATLDDAAFIFNLVNKPKFKQHIGDKNVRTLEDAKDYIQTRLLDSYASLGFGMFIVTLAEGDVPIGMCGFLKRPELEHEDIGYAFLPQFEGKGYAFEAVKTCIDHAQDFGIEKVVAIVSPENVASIRLLEKVGFQFSKEMMYNSKKTALYV